MKKISKRLLACALTLILLCALAAPAALAANMPYRITVDCTNNIVTVYSNLDDSIVRQMICSSGKSSSPTVKGTFHMPKMRKECERKEWYIGLVDGGYAKYGSRITGHFLFHSYLFPHKDDNSINWESYAAMGVSVSHGCIRLYVDDAKWIADNCLAGTEVQIFDNKKRYDYLKELLYQKTYTADSGSYEEFVGMASAEGELGYASTGDEVAALQTRMIELGLYDGEADGVYGEKMVRCMKAIQTALGRKVNGVADPELIGILMSQDAPSSTMTTLSTGANGPAVRSLQQTLLALGLYEGSVNGDFDEATCEAVRQFQRVCHLEDDGIVTPEVRQKMLDGFETLEENFPNGYAVEYDEDVQQTATVRSDGRLNLRKEMSTVSTIKAYLDDGMRVTVLEELGDWTRISVDGREGYVSSQYLEIVTETVRTPKYVAADAAHPALGKVQYDDTVIGAHAVTYATAEGKNSVNVRETPSESGKLAFMVPTGTRLRVLSENGSWVYVTYGGKSGFAKAGDFSMEQEMELENRFVNDVEEESDAPVQKNVARAMVINPDGADLRSIASQNGEVLCRVEAAEQVEVLFASGAWTQVRCGENTGYLPNEDLFTGSAEDLARMAEDMRRAQQVSYVVQTGSDQTLNLRAEPSSEAEVLTVLDNGTILSLLEDQGEWLHVAWGETEGYVMSAYAALLDKSEEELELSDDSMNELEADELLDEAEETEETEG